MDIEFKNFIEQVRNAVNIVDIVGSYVPLHKKGNKHWACCPFHGEKTPSFSVDEGKQLFYCFGCHVGGDVFKFLEKKDGLNFIEAVKFLAERYNIPVPQKHKSAQDMAYESEFNRITEVNDWAVKYFSACLRHNRVGAKGREYLAERGITEKIIEDFEIGYAIDSYDEFVDALLTKNITTEELVFAGLALPGKKAKPYAKFRNRIMIPIKNPRGKVVGFGGRVLGDGEPKYLNTGETKFFNKRYLLFGFDLAQKPMRESGQAVIVEGYMDAISLHAAGLRNVVASMGTAFSEQQSNILKRNTQEIIFCYDSDKAGRNASIRAVSIARKTGIKVKVATVPGAKDPDEFVRNQGLDAFKKVLAEAVDGLRFQTEQMLAGNDLTNVEGKIAAIKNIIPFLLECSSELEVAEEVKYISQKLMINDAVIFDELVKAKKQKQRYQDNETFAELPQKTTTIVETNRAERLLLTVLLNDLKLVPLCNEKLCNISFASNVLKNIFLKLNICYDEGREPTDLGMDLGDEESSLLASLKLENLPPSDRVRILEDCITEMQKSQLEKNYNEHAELAAQYEKNGDDRFLDELKICQEIRNDIKKICK